MDDLKVRELLSLWGERWGVSDLADRALCRFSSRMKRSLGRCYTSTGVISLNSALLQEGNGAVAVEVLCHEAAHLAATILGGRRVKPHGSEWRHLMEAAGYRARVRFPAGEVRGLATRGSAPKYEYLHCCRDCAATFKTYATNRRWRCRSCFTSGREGKLAVKRFVRGFFKRS